MNRSDKYFSNYCIVLVKHLPNFSLALETLEALEYWNRNIAMCITNGWYAK